MTIDFTTRDAAEPLHDGPTSTLYRVARAEEPGRVVVKVLKIDAASAEERLGRELLVAQHLRGPWALRCFGLARFRGQPALVLEDFGGQSLDRFIDAPLSANRFLEIALPLAEALAEMHARGYVHRDLKPANVLLNGATGEVKIADFGLATESRLASVLPPRVLEGTLPYMAPEQTGRMHRSIDERADLYSLGVTFYEMLTSELPFQARDALEWVHSHLARLPRPPVERVGSIPPQLSALVLKLLAKAPEDRYQTAAGVAHDLRRCEEDLSRRGTIGTFALGLNDVPREFQVPERLYGRDRELEVLLSSFAGVVASRSLRLLTVSGYSGIGKSSLVRQMTGPVAAAGGFFVSGKYDQYRKHVPYSAIAQAVRDLARQLLGASEDRLAGRRAQLEEALDGNGAALVEIIPELAQLLGPQPALPPLGPAESRNRFHYAFRALLRALASVEAPLVIFLDDLQWADGASLELLQSVASAPLLQGALLLILAFRENEVDRAHPFGLALEAISQSGVEIIPLVLGPLDRQSLDALVADALRSPPEAVRALSALLYQRTEGNPFFFGEYLKSLHREGVLRFDPATQAWVADLKQVEGRGINDNVAQFMVGRLRKLPVATQELLKLASCIGSTFDVPLLAAVREVPQAAALEALNEAARVGLIAVAEHDPLLGPLHRFQHDRIQHAAHALIDERWLPEIHLRIGRRLLERLDQAGLEERIFDVVNQLDEGLALVEEGAERERLFELNQTAARKASASNAWPLARRYLEVAVSLLGPDAWSRRPALAFALNASLAEAQYLCGDLAAARASFDALGERVRSDLERGQIFALQIRLFQVAGDFQEATAVALRSFELFGLRPPASNAEAALAVAVAKKEADALLGGRSIASLLDAPPLADPRLRMLAELLEASGPPLYMVKPALFPWVALQLLNLSLRSGNAEPSCYGYGLYGILLAGALGDPEGGLAFAQLAIRLNEKLGDAKLKGCMLHFLGDHVNFWKNPIASDLPILERGFAACLAGGDLIYSNYIGFQAPWHLYESGAPLNEVTRLTEKGVALALQSKYRPVLLTLRLEQQFVRALEGQTGSPASFDGPDFDEARALEEIAAAQFGCGIVYRHILKLVAEYTCGDLRRAQQAALAAEPHLGAAFSMPIEATFHFYHGLTLAALWDEAAHDEREQLVAGLDGEIAWMKVRAAACPANFAHKASFLEAERARIGGDGLSALRACEAGIASAREQRMLQYQALGHELAARVCRAQGLPLAAQEHVRAASARYRRWGAVAKVTQLEEAFGAPHAEGPFATTPSVSSASRQRDLDLLPVLKASQSLSSEIVLPRLLERLMQIVIESAGATAGFFLLAGQRGWSVAAETDANGARHLGEGGGPTPAERDLPLSIVNYVQRTQDKVLLEDARASNPFSLDEALHRRRPLSLLCLPISLKGKLTGILYLENNLVPGAFGPERLAVLELLASQMAISIDNSRLFAASQEAIALRDKFLTIASHELRTPLTPLKAQVQGLVRLLRKAEGPDLSRERLIVAAEVADRSVVRLTRLIEGLLDVGRIEANALDLVRKPLDLSALVAQVVERHRPELAASTVELRSDGPLLVVADAPRLEQVLVSLLLNAVKFGAGKPIVVSVGEEETGAILSVRDHGVGISPSDLTRLFTRFERGESSVNAGGLGLGLFVAREIVRAHGGTIRAESEPGLGTTITAVLPRGDEAGGGRG